MHAVSADCALLSAVESCQKLEQDKKMIQLDKLFNAMELLFIVIIQLGINFAEHNINILTAVHTFQNFGGRLSYRFHQINLPY